jgi:hypothetical protein
MSPAAGKCGPNGTQSWPCPGRLADIHHARPDGLTRTVSGPHGRWLLPTAPGQRKA